MNSLERRARSHTIRVDELCLFREVLAFDFNSPFAGSRWSSIARIVYALLHVTVALSFFASCNHQRVANTSGAISQRGYLWQRDWSAPVTTAFKEADARLAGVVVLGGEIEWNGGAPTFHRANIAWDVMRDAHKPVSLALRVAPFAGPFLADDAHARLVREMAKSLVEKARQRHLPLAEFQLDFDCAQQKLSGYHTWVQQVRAAIQPIPLTITALPSWLGERDFPALANAAGAYVLQVHSVPLNNSNAAPNVCDPTQARRWVQKAGELGLPFSVALPTYRCVAGYGGDGKLLDVAMDSVQPAWPAGTRVLEFESDPVGIAALVHGWQASRPATMRGLIWYRVPTALDRRNWRWPTLTAVMEGRPPSHQVVPVLTGENPIDVSVVNRGEAEEAINESVSVSWSSGAMTASDALTGWTLKTGESSAVFSRTVGEPIRLLPGEQRDIGWLRYDRTPDVQLQTAIIPIVRLALTVLFLGAAASRCLATGYFGPTIYLEDGGRRVTESPEFYWELEVKRLARDFHPPEKWQARPKMTAAEEDGTVLQESLKTLGDQTAQADHADFEAALRDGLIKPPDATAATQQDEAARAAVVGLTSDKLPPEFASEFADYHRGAFAFRKGPPEWRAAREAWETLLARPAEERHYRSVWAAFMIGKMLMKAGDPAAVQWFERTRALARDGFADSLGLAADSYGWEGRSEWKQGHPEKAAPLFLTQLALGDESAVISLKALIPDREPVEGFVNYGREPAEVKEGDAAIRAREQDQLQSLGHAVRDPLLLRLITMHILAVGADPYFAETTGRPAVKRGARWLAVIEAAHLRQTDDAEYLGWLAYSDGKYDQAARWLSLSKGDSPAALWLQAKLQRRAGKLTEAIESMARAWQGVRDIPTYTGWRSAAAESDAGEEPTGFSDFPRRAFRESASGDLGGLHLARADFVESLDAFLKGGLWSDGAFIAERVLTADELKTYVDQQPGDVSSTNARSDEHPDTLRYLLGRRLVREDRYAEAAAYLPPLYQKVLERYVQALNDGANASLTKAERACAWFSAAWIARFDGMELMGTEGAPDAFTNDGNFEETDLAKERLSGSYVHVSWMPGGVERKETLPIPLRPSTEEKQRLSKKAVQPDLRFHYRFIAVALAERAAALLPDNADELADVLNQAGFWIRGRDEKLAHRLCNVIERRAPKTPLGAAVLAKHWLVDEKGPWSQEQSAAHDLLVPPPPPEQD